MKYVLCLYILYFQEFFTVEQQNKGHMDFGTNQVHKLIAGIIAILVIYIISSVIHQYLIVQPYENMFTGEKQILNDKSVLLFVPTAMTALIGHVYNKRLQERVEIPQKNSIYCAALVFVSTITYTWAAAKTSYPVVLVFKSCNIMAVLLVAILCTRVKEKKLVIGSKKIIVGAVVSVGVFLFNYFDPQMVDRTSESQYVGIALLLISLLADGFLPDFQAEIKSVYKPQPSEMMVEINKWVAVLSLISIIASLSAHRVINYLFAHPLFVIHLIGMSLLSTAGQLVVYYMIKQFKQHIVPFVITLRKILTIGINIFYYDHKSSLLQAIGVFVVLAAVLFQFKSQTQPNPNAHIAIKEQQLAENQEFELIEHAQIIHQPPIEENAVIKS